MDFFLILFHLCLFWTYVFLAKNFILNNLTAVFSGKICCKISNKNLYWNLRIMDASGLLSLVYSTSLQIRHIPVRNNIFPGNNNPVSIKPTVALVTFSEKTTFEISLPQSSKQKETNFATRKILQNFEGHDQWYCRHVTWMI